ASGKVADIHAFQVRGWELVVSDLSQASLERHRSRVRTATQIAEGRYALELPLEPAPDQLLRDLIGEGAHLVALNPTRETLEDFFVQQIQKQDHARRPLHRD